MPTVRIEYTSCTADFLVDDELVLSTALDLTGDVVLSLPEMMELLEEASDNLVQLTQQEE